MSDLGLVLRQTSFELRTFRRNVPAAFFTGFFPLMMLVILGSIQVDNTLSERSGMAFNQFFVPGIMAYGLIGACFTNIGMRISLLRDNGILKRLRGTPLPTWAYIAGQVLTSVVITLVLSTIIVAFGMVFFDVHVYAATLPGVVLAGAIGAATFCALGLAITCAVPNGDAATPIVQFSLLPLTFISDVFYPDPRDSWTARVADWFPVRHLANAYQHAFTPGVAGPGVRWPDLLVMAAWGLGGVLVTLKWFRWENKRPN